MQKFTQKYTIISILEDVEEGYEFSSSNWPLHTTIVDTFAIDWSVPKLSKKLEEMALTTKSIKTRVTKDEYFGPERTVHVVLLDKVSELASLHYRILDSLKGGGVTLNDAHFSEKGFAPHITVQEHTKLMLNDIITIHNIALIDMFPDENPYQRKILRAVKLR